MSMIFQSYALWPHMTVTENIVYGLKLRKIDQDTIDRKLTLDPGDDAAATRWPTVIRANCRAASSSGSRSRAP